MRRVITSFLSACFDSETTTSQRRAVSSPHGSHGSHGPNGTPLDEWPSAQGDHDGLVLGLPLGEALGDAEGLALGEIDGDCEGLVDGLADGDPLGLVEGCLLYTSDAADE